MAWPLFFIALLPDEEIRAEVTGFKTYAAEYFSSSRALRSPPHITLIPPFRWPEDKEEELCKALAAFASEEHPFSQGLVGFDCFSPRVIFVSVERTFELKSLQERLEQYLLAKLGLENNSRHDFNPHMTVAFKDLRRRIFPKAWAYFSEQEYKRRFQADAIHLLKHNGQRWELSYTFNFSNS